MLSKTNRIQILAPEQARRIAAGEVIDRPASLLREFLDNAIDAGSKNIDVSIEEGGCKKVEVTDDGDGMSLEDLKLCVLTHATSKIRSLEDLEKAVTLGFRGEALAAAGAVACLEIITSEDGRQAFHLVTGPGESHPQKIEQSRRTKGTTVRALNLFESIPARKRFLKREGSEAALCRQIFIDKALAFNDINFRFYNDGKLRDFLPSCKTKKERFAAALLQSSPSMKGEENFLHEINVTGEGFSSSIVIGSPMLARNDRKYLYVFANGRRVQDYSLVQAIEYGSQGWFANSAHPVSAAFINIDPSLADFNIHPAKREVRFRDPGAIHHAISGGVKNFFHSLYLRNTENKRNDECEMTDKELDYGEPEVKKEERKPGIGSGEQKTKSEKYNTAFNCAYNTADISSIRNIFNNANLQVKEPAPVYGQPRYAGRIFNLFILIEWGDKLYIIDQHAAHERILYNKFLEEPVPKQELLTPVPFVTESAEEDAFLDCKREELSRLGVDIKKDCEKSAWQIQALPADWRLTDTATVKEILDLRTAGENMAKKWAANLCCKAAIKDGDYPDDETAFSLAKEALSLAEPYCPHGRPIWTEITRLALFRAVKRE